MGAMLFLDADFDAGYQEFLEDLKTKGMKLITCNLRQLGYLNDPVPRSEHNFAVLGNRGDNPFIPAVISQFNWRFFG